MAAAFAIRRLSHLRTNQQGKQEYGELHSQALVKFSFSHRARASSMVSR
jgi:hypothetical protein